MSLLFLLIIILLIVLYICEYITGKTFIIIVLLLIIFLIFFAIGTGIADLFLNVCMNKKCDVVKLPLDIVKIGQINAGNYLYRVLPLNSSYMKK